VQLTDPKGRMHTIELVAGKEFHTHKGSIQHDELIGSPEGSVITTTGNVTYLAMRPLLSDFVLSMPRGAAVVYPKDAGQVVHMADIFPGARVVEAGVGSGALTMSLLRAVGDDGHVSSYERRSDFAEIARDNVESFFGGPHPAWTLTVGDLVETLDEKMVDPDFAQFVDDHRGVPKRGTGKQTAQQRRLAGPIRAGESEPVSPLDLERDAVEEDVAGQLLAER